VGQGEEVVVEEEECKMHGTQARGRARTEVCLLLPAPRAASVAGQRGACFGSRLMRMAPELVVRLELVRRLVARLELVSRARRSIQ
jgi:hypothetical protein